MELPECPPLPGDDVPQEDGLEVALQQLGVPHVRHTEHKPAHRIHSIGYDDFDFF
jgi:hypothetical protein